ncbi:hypothetical protein DFH07DRAFT_523299 [Mycena maculata]|uniref:Uncharacterized protein n=1 Tax=Mycena maculata TaxID=230809 RepID=A0AAD7N9T2_9AGAR|nr:hypothetical protein DFH07DRAFT_523299 [Mycena maculata]
MDVPIHVSLLFICAVRGFPKNLPREYSRVLRMGPSRSPVRSSCGLLAVFAPVSGWSGAFANDDISPKVSIYAPRPCLEEEILPSYRSCLPASLSDGLSSRHLSCHGFPANWDVSPIQSVQPTILGAGLTERPLRTARCQRDHISA